MCVGHRFCQLISTGHTRQRRPLRHVQRLIPQRGEYPYQTADNIHSSVKLGDINLLLWNARGAPPHDFDAAALAIGKSARWCGHAVGFDRHAHRRRDKFSRSLRPALLPRLRGEHYTDGLYVHSQWILYAKRTSIEAELVVLGDGWMDHHWRCAELRLCTDQRWIFEEMAIYLSFCGRSYSLVWAGMFCHTQLGCLCLVSFAG